MQRILAAIAALAIAACTPAPQPPPAAQWQRCTNPQHGIDVSYPAGWYTNSGTGDGIPPCSAFDPQPIDLPRDSEIPFDIAVFINVETLPLEQTATPSQWERILSTERLTIAGRNAVRAEVEATGEGLADRGMRSLRYAMDLGNGRILIATTHRTDGSYEQNKEIVTRMIQKLVIR